MTETGNDPRVSLEQIAAQTALFTMATRADEKYPRVFAALRAVLDLHSPAPFFAWCRHCGGDPWPCSTARAISTALEEIETTQESRELFDRPIPQHISTERHREWTALVCLRPHVRGGGPWKALVYHTGTARELDHLDKFLKVHSHETAEDPA